MAKYELKGNGLFEARSSAELVSLMMEELQGWQPIGEVFEFMKMFAQREKLQSGSIVRIDSTGNFISDLLKIGTLKEVMV